MRSVPIAAIVPAFAILRDESTTGYLGALGRGLCAIVIFSRFNFGDTGMFGAEDSLTSAVGRRTAKEDVLSGTLLVAQPLCLSLAVAMISHATALVYGALISTVIALNVLWLNVRGYRNMKAVAELNRLAPGHADIGRLVEISRVTAIWWCNNLGFLLVSAIIALASFKRSSPNAETLYQLALLVSSVIDYSLTRMIYDSPPASVPGV